MSRKRYKHTKLVSFVELSDDPDELLELLSQAESLSTQAENELKLRRTERAFIKAKLKKVRQEYKKPHVSDHAVVRYLERVTGVDIESCKEEMLSKLPSDYTHSDDVAFVKISSDGLQFVIRDNLIVSVTPVTPKEIDR